MLSDCEEPTRQREIDTTRATARLANLDIEIIHRRSPDGDAEQISINLQAVPSFEALRRIVESANPFALWAQAVQTAWLPWLAAADVVLSPGGTLPPADSEATSRSRATRRN
jgi:hypothetical protein